MICPASGSENGMARRYEELRSFALGEKTCVEASRGLALFLKEGMAAWISAWSLPAPCSLGARKHVDADVLPKWGRADEVAVVLANMALVSLGEVRE